MVHNRVIRIKSFMRGESEPFSRAKTSWVHIMQIAGKLQYYNFWGHKIPLRCFRKELKASRFSINETNQNLWIPNKHLDQDGSIKDGQNIDYVIIGSRSQIKCSNLFSKSFFEKPFLSKGDNNYDQ